MKRLTASWILVALTLGQGLSWICVGPAGSATSSLDAAAMAAEQGALHGSHGPAHEAQADPGQGSRHASEGGSHHGSEDGSCDAMMACGMAGAAVELSPVPVSNVATLWAAPEPGSLLQRGLTPQEPPPPRFV